MRTTHYLVTLLASGDSPRSQALGVSRRGVVGSRLLPGEGEQATYWQHLGQPQPLTRTRMGIQSSHAWSIGPEGIVGSALSPLWGCQPHSYFWQPEQELMRSLHPPKLLGAGSESHAVALAGSRVIGVGQGARTGDRPQALAWMDRYANYAHIIHPEAILGPRSRSHARGADAEWIVGSGSGSLTQDREQALLWTEPTAIDALTLHPAELLGVDSVSFAVAVRRPWIVGYGRGEKTGGRLQALLWPDAAPSSCRSLHPSQLLGTDSSSWITAQQGEQLVGAGRGRATGHSCHALLWPGAHADAVVDLHTFAPAGALTSRACAIDSHGIIAGCIDDQAALWIPDRA